MNWRLAVAAVLLVFAWKGSEVTFTWPQTVAVEAPKPPKELLAWAEPMRKVLPTMLPADRKYLANFYDAMATVLVRDGGRELPIIGTSAQFEAFHGGSLRLAIDKAKVGQYPGLDEAIDQTFLNACGADQQKLDKKSRDRLVSACGVLSWVLTIGHE